HHALSRGRGRLDRSMDALRCPGEEGGLEWLPLHRGDAGERVQTLHGSSLVAELVRKRKTFDAERRCTSGVSGRERHKALVRERPLVSGDLRFREALVGEPLGVLVAPLRDGDEAEVGEREDETFRFAELAEKTCAPLQ